MEHLRDPFPASWFTVKNKLANLKKNFITYEQYQELCAADGIMEPISQDTLLGFLHNLGIVVNFGDDPRLADTHVLSPHWVTNGVNKILNAETLVREEGQLSYHDLPKVLDATEYPRNMYWFLLNLMEKFELCYEVYDRDREYLVPELLGKEEPKRKEFAAADALRFEYRYNILPEGLLPRFIVRSRVLNQGLPRWRTGAVLAFEDNHAMVKADIQDRKVSVAVIGDPAGRWRLLSVIRSNFEHIHSSIACLQAEEMVSVPEHPGVVVPYTDLRTMEAEGYKERLQVIGGKVVKLDVTALLSGVEEPAARTREPVRETGAALKKAISVVFSYSHKDEELRDQLETHLKILQRKGLIITWHDCKIKAGGEWKGMIDKDLQHDDLILLLVSADFLASDYCYEIEMKTALERHERSEAKVVPIILRACEWQEARFAKLQALPKDGKPVTSWPNRDEAWTDVAKGIKETVEEIRRRRG